ncbi:MAG TPA: ABC transporter permease, partial [Streptosporangiaceae bacterium]
MIWLTWRQFRIPARAALAALAVLAAALALTGPRLVHLYASSGIATCHTHGNCDAVINAFISEARGSGLSGALYFLGIGIVFAAPGLVGVFWGAPLVARELEAGTHRLVWNQSVTRTRWLAVKLGLVGLASVATAGLFSLMVTWWAAPIDKAVMNRITPSVFAARDIAPIGYAAFAFALGVAAGVLIRRTVPAMAVTLAVFAFVQIAVPLWVRPHLMTPVRTVTALDVSGLTQLRI